MCYLKIRRYDHLLGVGGRFYVCISVCCICYVLRSMSYPIKHTKVNVLHVLCSFTSYDTLQTYHDLGTLSTVLPHVPLWNPRSLSDKKVDLLRILYASPKF